MKVKKEKKKIINIGMRLFSIIGIVACLFAAYLTAPQQNGGNADAQYVNSSHYVSLYTFGADYYTESYKAEYEMVNGINDLGDGLSAVNRNALSISEDLSSLEYTIRYVAHLMFGVFAVGFFVLFFTSAKPNPNYKPIENNDNIKQLTNI